MVKLADKKIFTKLDLVRSFHHNPTAKQDFPEAALITPFGLYEFVVMTFQHFMDEVHSQ